MSWAVPVLRGVCAVARGASRSLGAAVSPGKWRRVAAAATPCVPRRVIEEFYTHSRARCGIHPTTTSVLFVALLLLLVGGISGYGTYGRMYGKGGGGKGGGKGG